MRWLLALTNLGLPLAYMSLQGHLDAERAAPRAAVVWETLLIQTLQLLTDATITATTLERVSAALMFLLSFDLYLRGTEALKIFSAEHRTPLRAAVDYADAWSVTLSPSHMGELPKTGRANLTNTIGTMHPARAWLSRLGPILRRLGRGGDRLFRLTPRRYLALFHASRAAAGLKKAEPHGCRHGGPSVDAMLKSNSDQATADRGDWGSERAIRVYRRPGPYLRLLHALSPEQLAMARAAPEQIIAESKRLVTLLRL